MCKPGKQVGTVKFTVRNGKTTSPGVTVRKPGVYTWVVSIKGDSGQTAKHKCGVKAESTKVVRPAYGPIDIETGVKKAGSAARLAPGSTVGATAIGMKSALVTVGIRGRQMVIPTGANQAGWLNRSAAPGEVLGTTVVAAHVSDNRDTPMAFWKLKNLRKGKIVTIKSDGKTYRYKVKATAKFSRDRGPGIPKRFFKTTGKNRLVLVTCTDKVTRPNGSFHYTNNLVVTAKRIK
nr:class F sortase [Nocardioides alcanivorans]